MAISYAVLVNMGKALAQIWNKLPKGAKRTILTTIIIPAIKKAGEDIYEYLKKWFKVRGEKKKAEEKKGKSKNPTVLNDPKQVGKTINLSTNKEVIPGWIVAGDMCYIVAPTGVGKTTLSVGLACAMAKGETSVLNPDEKALKHQVLYYMMDAREDTIFHNYPHLKDYFPELKFNLIEGGVCKEDLINDIRSNVKKSKDSFVTVFIDNLNRVEDNAKLHKELEVLRAEMKDKEKKILTSIILNHTSSEYSKYKSHLPIESADVKGFKENIDNADDFIVINRTCLDKNILIINQRKYRWGEEKENSIVVGREKSDHLHFVYFGEDREEDMLPLSKRAKVDARKEAKMQAEAKKSSRGRNLKLTTEQELMIVEVYHTCDNNFNAAAKYIQESDEPLLKDIEKFAPLQVKRIIKKYE